MCKGREGHRMEGVQKPKGIRNSEWRECKRPRERREILGGGRAWLRGWPQLLQLM